MSVGLVDLCPLLIHTNTFPLLGVLVDQADPSMAWAQPALGQAWPFDYSIRVGAWFFNFGPFNLWAGLGFSCREPKSRPGPNIIMVLAKILM